MIKTRKLLSKQVLSSVEKKAVLMAVPFYGLLSPINPDWDHHIKPH